MKKDGASTQNRILVILHFPFWNNGNTLQHNDDYDNFGTLEKQKLHAVA